MKYFIVEDNIVYAEKVKQMLDSLLGEEKSNSVIIDCIGKKDWESDFFQKLFSCAVNNAEACLIIDSELRCKEIQHRSQLEGASLAHTIMASMNLGFKGKIILYGFLPTNILKKIEERRRIFSLIESQERGVSYVQLPISRKILEDELKKLNQN